MRKKRNYARFYAIARAAGIDLEASKDDLVLQFTDGRTAHLSEMTEAEYQGMCDRLQGGDGGGRRDGRDEVRRRRSAVLRRLQRRGVDTTDWEAGNAFCSSARIAGKPFGRLSADELKGLVPKLESMLRKKAARGTSERPSGRVFLMPVAIRRNQMLS